MIVWKKIARTCLILGLGLAPWAASLALGETRFDREITAIVQEIVPQIEEYIAKNPGKTVTVDPFINKSDAQPSPGLRISLGITQGLEKQGIKVVKRSGDLRISGFFKAGTDKVTRQPSMSITYAVEDASPTGNGQRLVRNTRIVVDPLATLETAGLNANIPVTASEEERKEAVNKAIVSPNVSVESSRVRTKKDSPYAMEIRVDGKPREVVMKDGVPYVSLGKGETFIVRLINDSKSEAGVSLSIDGINSFTFLKGRDGAKATPMNDWTVPAGGAGDIPGWYIDEKTFEHFEITDDPKDIAALTINNDTSDVGTITGVFKASWPTDGTPPKDEPNVQKATPGAKSPEIGVKRGAKGSFDAPPRDTICGVIRDSITIRYQKLAAAAPAQVAADNAEQKP